MAMQEFFLSPTLLNRRGRGCPANRPARTQVPIRKHFAAARGRGLELPTADCTDEMRPFSSGPSPLGAHFPAPGPIGALSMNRYALLGMKPAGHPTGRGASPHLMSPAWIFDEFGCPNLLGPACSNELLPSQPMGTAQVAWAFASGLESVKQLSVGWLALKGETQSHSVLPRLRHSLLRSLVAPS